MEAKLFVHHREYTFGVPRAFRERILPATLGFSICRRGGYLFSLKVPFHGQAPEHASKIETEFAHYEDVQKHIAFIGEAGICSSIDSNNLILVEPLTVVAAMLKADIYGLFSVPRPPRLQGPVCSECGCPGAYVGFTSIECRSKYCKHYTPNL